MPVTDKRKLSRFMSCGGCAAKLPQSLLKDALAKIPVFNDANLLIGFESADDGAVYKLNDDLAVIQTLDFFPPMVDDPYLFGQIAAANALSDIYAMGGEVRFALNIVCFPEEEDPSVLAEILRGGADKVAEAGGVLCGGHSIDGEVKYGLCVTGTARPDKIYFNNRCRIGDKIILTKPLGAGIVAANKKTGGVSAGGYGEAVFYMRTLNKYAYDIIKNYAVHSCTDVTGFGFLGHLNEMVTDAYSISVDSGRIPYIPEALRLAKNFLITAGGQKNRDFLENKVRFINVGEPVQEILFDPQTSGGLLVCVAPEDAPSLLAALDELEIKSSEVAMVTERHDTNVVVS